MSITFYNHWYWKITVIVTAWKNNHGNAQHCRTRSLKVKPLWCVIWDVAAMCVRYAAIRRRPPTFYMTFSEKNLVLDSENYGTINGRVDWRGTCLGQQIIITRTYRDEMKKIELSWHIVSWVFTVLLLMKGTICHKAQVFSFHHYIL